MSGKNMHVSIDVLVRKFGDVGQRRLKFLVTALIILFCVGVMVVGGGRLVYITHVLDQHSPALQVPLSVVYSIIPISGLLIVFYKVSDLINTGKWS